MKSKSASQHYTEKDNLNMTIIIADIVSCFMNLSAVRQFLNFGCILQYLQKAFKKHHSKNTQVGWISKNDDARQHDTMMVNHLTLPYLIQPTLTLSNLDMNAKLYNQKNF